MKKYIYFSVLVLFCTSGQAAEIKPVLSKIDVVTVYQDRALVSRIGRITLPVGIHKLSFEGLPYGLDDNSVRVSGDAPGAAILDIQIKSTTSIPPLPDSLQAARRKKIFDKVNELEMIRSDNVDKINVINSQKALLEQIKVQTGGNINEQLKLTRPTTEDWQKFVDFVGMNGSKLIAEQRKYERMNQELKVKIDSLRLAGGSDVQANSKPVKTVLVELDVTRAGEVEFTASYVVRGASWTPTYDLRVQKATKDIQLDYRASIRQNTGEDWNNVAITLSTARPDVGGNQPILGSWYISGSEPPKPMAQRKNSDDGATDALSPSSRDRVRAMSSSSVNSTSSYNRIENVAIAQPLARIESDYYSTMFDIVAKSTIPSDDIPHKVVISKLKLAAEFGYSCTPKLSLNVYLKATIKNTSDIPILPGTMSIYSDRDYISQSTLQFVSPSETFTASIGVDPSITIHRNRTTNYESSGVFTKSKVVKYNYEYILQNNRKKDTVQVEVLDQIPLSQNEKIVIEQLDPNIKEIRANPDGIISWKQTVKPNEKKNWNLNFSVEFPVDFIMRGME